MIGLVAVLKVTSGKEKEALESCRQIAGEVNKKEKGCLLYEPYTARDNPSEIYFLEKYAAMEDLEEHRQSKHYQEFKEKMKDVLAEPPTVTVLHPV